MRRVLSAVIFLLLLVIGWTVITVLMLTERNFTDAVDAGSSYAIALKFIPSLGISAVNSIIPKISLKLTELEKWDDPAFSLKLNIARLYLLKVLNLILFALFNIELATNGEWFGDENRLEFENGSYDCREDQVGASLGILVLSEAIVSKIMPLLEYLWGHIWAKIRSLPF